MAINKPTIAGQPAKERRNVVEQSFSPRPVAPDESGTDVVDRTLVPIDPLTPGYEGQMSFVLSVDDSGKNRWCTIYVAVDISGTLTWKQVTPVPNIINQYTGKPYDPIYD